MSETNSAMTFGKIASPIVSMVFRLLTINHVLIYGLPLARTAGQGSGVLGVVRHQHGAGLLVRHAAVSEGG